MGIYLYMGILEYKHMIFHYFYITNGDHIPLWELQNGAVIPL